MRHHNRIKKFGRVRKVRRALMRGLAFALLRDKKILTTEAKAKALRPFAERLITLSRRGTLAAHRTVIARLGTRASLPKICAELVKRYGARDGGYTRVVKAGMRRSDGARMAIIELV
ncbi:MAG: large subunit ribosomal protein L17 [Parcubacteria group bacterium Greene0416_79]|nr:MAG: large subunit ribosomal protein L17 [Parcubacteria group bacterium Greene0416_79]